MPKIEIEIDHNVLRRLKTISAYEKRTVEDQASIMLRDVTLHWHDWRDFMRKWDAENWLKERPKD